MTQSLTVEMNISGPTRYIGVDVSVETRSEAWAAKQATMEELCHYAQICRMTIAVRPNLETLT